MAEIDLIPAAYRRGILLRRWLARFALVYGALLLGTGGAKWVLASNLDAETAEIVRLKADAASLLSRRTTLDRLEAKRAVLGRRLSVLEKLRGGPRVAQVFTAVDRALDGQVWFLDWQFMRAGEYVPVGRKSVETGYFIIASEGRPNGERRAWQLMTHMRIKAQAADHSALSSFVQRLSRQPVIKEVKIINTRAQPARSGSIVDFELAVVVRGEPDNS